MKAIQPHTPGPWAVGKPQWKRGGPPYKIAITAASGTLANVLTHERGANGGEPDNANGNAHLVGAGPDLLAACKMALPHHQGQKSEVGKSLREAIDKAEGRA